jgi:hypothetical protein
MVVLAWIVKTDRLQSELGGSTFLPRMRTPLGRSMSDLPEYHVINEHHMNKLPTLMLCNLHFKD